MKVIVVIHSPDVHQYLKVLINQSYHKPNVIEQLE